VISGYATDPDGELKVLAFSMGLFPDHALLIALPALLQFQRIERPLEDVRRELNVL